MTQSTLLPRKFRVIHDWNEHVYFIEFRAVLRVGVQKWFVVFEGSSRTSNVMICNPSFKNYGGFWDGFLFDEIGYDSPEDALAAFDEAMAVRYKQRMLSDG